VSHPSVMLRGMRSSVANHPAGRLRGDALLARLRGDAGARPAIDPGLAGGLRDWLEDELSGAVASLPEDAAPVRVTKDALDQVLVCEAHFQAHRSAPRRVTVELVRGTMVDLLFRQWVTTGALDDPWNDALEALWVTDDDGARTFVDALAPEARQALALEVEAHAARIAACWPVLAPSWMARTQERLTVPLAGGRVLLSGVVDLAIGAPSSGRASVCIVEVKSGRRRVEHRGDVHLYALLETLRAGAPPFRVATFYTADGELDVEAVGRDALLGALHRVVAGTVRLCRLATGGAAERTPNALCAWCAGLPGCEPGRRQVDEGRAPEGSGPWG
jgi:PD-(D/E)XK nuclease superfamily